METKFDECLKEVKKIKGYSPDFYYCVCFKIQEGMDFDKALGFCDETYG